MANSEPRWDYQEAFSRNLGLISEVEQTRLRLSTVGIAGMGGVGGVELMTLVRLGVGGFHIADPDVFDVANINRQYGATVEEIGKPKAKVMASCARRSNPDADVVVFEEKVTSENVTRFLDGVDILVDGLDVLAIDARRLLFLEAARRGIYTVTAAPFGFSCAMMVFCPNGVGFDEYFGLKDGQDLAEQVLRFGIGVAPRQTFLRYMDLDKVSIRDGRAPSLGLATNLCAGMAVTEVVRILLHRKGIRCAPCYSQFDMLRGMYKRGYMPWGNRNPGQRLKMWFGRRKYM